MSDAAKSMVIRKLNDQLRITLTGGKVMMTSGIAALSPETQARILAAVRGFTAFNKDNDPWGEHDFGSLDIDGERVFFKLDAYDHSLREGSPDPANPAVTVRVLTIMLADEY
ncbi:MAG: DUF3768 domain-containing protein [Hyphomicrobiaceae bacterium]